MELDTFLNLPTSAIVSIVCEHQLKTVAFPINGTRRWFLLEQLSGNSPTIDYVQQMVNAHIEQYQLFFEHGINTLLAPIFGPDLLDRGNEYTDMAIRGIEELVKNPAFLDFYDTYQVKVRIYGDYRHFLENTAYAFLLDSFAELEERTAHHTQHRLLFGVCANDPVDMIADLTVQFYQAHQRTPTKCELIQAYYGDDIDPLSLFIGFDKFAMFDVPLVTTGNEDLYFTVSPSLYMNATQLREILYDHLFTRRLEETDYAELTEIDLTLMHQFYSANKHRTLGVGGRQTHGDYWYPYPSVTMPDGFIDN